MSDSSPAAATPRDMTTADVPGVVDVHRACFPDYFMTGLGRGILTRFYRSAVESPACMAAVLEFDGRIVGLAVGTLDPAFHTQLMRRHFIPFVAAILRGLFVSPAVRAGLWQRMSFVKRLFRPHRDPGPTGDGVPPAPGPEARFLDVAVHPDMRGGGNAERLVNYFADRLFEMGATRIGGSVFPENLASLILYKRIGWNVKRTGPRRVDVWIDRSRKEPA